MTKSMDSLNTSNTENSNPNMTDHQDVQKIYIAKDMVGALIGKAGMRIQEIRRSSGCKINISDMQNEIGERLVSIAGTPTGTHCAISMIREQLEAEQQRQALQEEAPTA